MSPSSCQKRLVARAAALFGLVGLWLNGYCFSFAGLTGAQQRLHTNLVGRQAMITVPGDMKNGLRIVVNGVPMIVQEFLAKKQGKGVAICKTKLKNLINGATVTESLSSGSRYEVFETDWKVGTYSYRDEDADDYVLMDMETFEEFRIPGGIIGELGQWLVEGMQLDFELYDGRVVNTQMNSDIIMEIADVKSSKDNGRDCQVVLSNGVTRTGPSYLKAGDKVLLDKVNFQISKRV
eukprot:TRINITY_DN107622_c0_g1_i1.p1 TRINITY_DN107622_c0_g1~~TRINITY_DN107622_c0_g1_i1.p1  ORF type:complete len:236 (+),score=52.91 TRINITY_DN107622_c0_g1_i1:66-773(+)